MRKPDNQNLSQGMSETGSGDRKTPAPHLSDTDYPEILRRMDELGLMDDSKFRTEVLDAFLRDASKTIEDLEAAIRASDAAACELLAHRMRGASLTLGAEKLGGIALRLEQFGQDGNLSTAGSLAAALREEFESIRTFFTRLPGIPKAAWPTAPEHPTSC